jgi:hypothetical protein
MIVKEDKSRSWKLLRKFYSEKKLNMVGLFKTYDFMDAPLTIKDLPECNTP